MEIIAPNESELPSLFMMTTTELGGKALLISDLNRSSKLLPFYPFQNLGCFCFFYMFPVNLLTAQGSVQSKICLLKGSNGRRSTSAVSETSRPTCIVVYTTTVQQPISSLCSLMFLLSQYFF